MFRILRIFSDCPMSSNLIDLENEEIFILNRLYPNHYNVA